MHGRVVILRDGRPFIETDNVVVAGALIASANLAAGITAGNAISLFAVGSGNVTPTTTDIRLSGPAQYFNRVTGYSFPSPGAVTFTFSLTSADYGATPGIVIQEIGLFGNTIGTFIPASVGIVSQGWAASTAYTIGTIIRDSNNSTQRCTTAGTSKTAPAPTWATSIGATTTDNSVVWTMVAAGVAAVPMWSHAVVPSFTFTGAAAYTGSWALTY